MPEETQQRKRFEELAQRAYSRGVWVYTDFLNIAEQSLLKQLKLPVEVALEGGYEAAERRIACLGSEELCGCEFEPPFVCINIQPIYKKYADALTHRDFFGSVMALGLRREALGDIVVAENCAYLFCAEAVAEYITDNLTQVKHTAVKCARVEVLPVESAPLPDEEEIVIASQRLDAVVAEVWNLSRSGSKELAEQGKVFVNSVLTQNPSYQLKEEDIVSVRGTGRFVYCGIARETKKGKLRARVRIYR